MSESSVTRSPAYVNTWWVNTDVPWVRMVTSVTSPKNTSTSEVIMRRRMRITRPLDQHLTGLPFIRQVGSQGNALLHVQEAIEATLFDVVWDLVWQARRHCA